MVQHIKRRKNLINRFSRTGTQDWKLIIFVGYTFMFLWQTLKTFQVLNVRTANNKPLKSILKL
jgi:hypothetical protein